MIKSKHKILLKLLLLALLAGAVFTVVAAIRQPATTIITTEDTPDNNFPISMPNNPIVYTVAEVQESYLREELPIINDHYHLDYNYKEWQFIVMLQEPYEENYSKFFEWLTNNYPDISPEEFSFFLEE